MLSPLQPISYKDPAGFIVKKDKGYFRYISNSYQKEFDHLINSGLYRSLIDKYLILPHQTIMENQDASGYYKVLFPEQIPYISYPYEWTYSQWREMALTYIQINLIAVEYGMILKDASPYNFVFYKGYCRLLDTLSFSFYTEGQPWFAYKQCCEEILSPLTLMYYKDALWGKLSRSHINGFPLSFVSNALPLKSWFNSFCLLHIHAHAKFQKTTKSVSKDKVLSKEKLIALLHLMKKNILKWEQPALQQSTWSDYYEKDIAEDAYLDDKTNIIRKWLMHLQPNTVIDIGANTGKFSFLAAAICDYVVVVEEDMACVEKIQAEIKSKACTNINTLVADITQPSPGLGWENKEKKALLERVQGDMVIMLALVHHLCISKNIPLSFVAKLTASITTRYAIIEFVPKEDSKAAILLANRKDIFNDYTEEKFIAHFQNHFSIIQSHPCQASSRKLFLLEKK